MSQAGRPFSIGGVITADVAPAAWRRSILNENQIPLLKKAYRDDSWQSAMTPRGSRAISVGLRKPTDP